MFNYSERLKPNGEPLGIQGTLEYSHDLFNRETAEAIASRLLRLLKQAVATPNVPICQFEILSAEERHALLEKFNAHTEDIHSNTLTSLFEAQAEKSPDATALIFGDERLSYSELNERANRLAHFLIRSGVAVGSLVGIALERSAEIVVAIVATLKAGAGYVPLDPDYLQARLAQMMSDANPVVLTRSELRDQLPRSEKI